MDLEKEMLSKKRVLYLIEHNLGNKKSFELAFEKEKSEQRANQSTVFFRQIESLIKDVIKDGDATKT